MRHPVSVHPSGACDNHLHAPPRNPKRASPDEVAGAAWAEGYNAGMITRHGMPMESMKMMETIEVHVRTTMHHVIAMLATQDE